MISKTKEKKIIGYLAFITLLISYKSSNQWSRLPIGNQLFWWLIQFVFITILLTLSYNLKKTFDSKNYKFIYAYLFWNVICIIRGTIIAENYWEWKMLVSTGYILLMPLIAYICISVSVIQYIIKTWYKYVFFLFLPVLAFLWGDSVGKFLIPFSFLLLFFPILTIRWKILLIIIVIFVITFDITARSNIIKFSVPLIISFLFNVRKKLSTKILNIARLFLLLIPIILLFLAIYGIFNVFKLDEYLGEKKTKVTTNSGKIVEQNLTADTRTLLYVEVFESAIKNKYVIFGRTPARGNDSNLFGENNQKKLKTNKKERFSNEVSILNIFTWSGIVGVLLYFLIFIRASYLAINKSNNLFTKLIGINICFRWTYGFVEDFSQFDLSNIFLWIMIGMCFSSAFRQMDNNQMQFWIRSIIDFKRKNLICT